MMRGVPMSQCSSSFPFLSVNGLAQRMRILLRAFAALNCGVISLLAGLNSSDISSGSINRTTEASKGLTGG